MWYASGCQSDDSTDPSVFVVKVKVSGALVPRHDDSKTISMLNRVLCWVDGTAEKRECIEYEAEPRLREVLLLQLVCLQHVESLHRSKKVGADDSAMASLEDGAAETFRSAVRRLGFLVLDRSVIQYSAKEAARGMVKAIVICAFCADVFAS